MKVKKRDGRIVDFNEQKIIRAILSAFESVDGKVTQYAVDKAYNIASYVSGYFEEDETNPTPDIEEIQDIIEKGLMATKRKDVAKAYILYREERNKIRNKNSALMQSIAEKISASDVQNQNANVDEYSFGGRMGEARNELMKDYALNYMVSPMAKENHINNMVYIHDLDSYAVGMHNCLTIPFDDLLAKGFNTRQTDVRPANSINTAFQLIAVIFQLQSLQQFGGVSASHIDWTMVPYVRKSFRKHYLNGLKYIKNMPDEDIEGIKNILIAKDPSIDNNIFLTAGLQCKQYAMDMTEKELMQAVEGMYHNLNTLQSRSGNQLPFTSINYGTCTLPEGRMVTKALLEGSIKGVGKIKKTAIFPCGIFQCMKGVNRKPGDPNYDLFKLALKSTAQRLYPNYVNVDWSVNAGYDINDPKTYVSTMGCRTYNGLDINAEPGTNPQTKDGRGNLAPVTIVMPTLAMMAKEAYEKDLAKEGEDLIIENVTSRFMTLLDQKIHEARDMLVERFEWMCQQSPESAKFMYENNVMMGYKPEEGIRSALKHGTLVIGQLGLAETLQILIGCDHTEEKGMELAKQIEQLFKDRCGQFKKDLKLNFGVYYTPAENMCYTAMKKFKKQYGIIPNVSDKDFFTNSMHVPVWKKMSPFEKIDIEAELTGYSSGGCITYIELEGGIKNNLDALETIVNYAMDKDIPYFAVNVPNDTCLDCGYCDEFNDACPTCGSEHIQQLRRVTGYLTGDYTTSFNKGKQQEVQMRVKHN
ncbi:MAG: anaerobic ribonucleoside-triphosphate reductase [Bacilli bacterium]|nr:anaerobic ribonucleoside-triphosphate reductase [Bacilli bacterium]